MECDFSRWKPTYEYRNMTGKNSIPLNWDEVYLRVVTTARTTFFNLLYVSCWVSSNMERDTERCNLIYVQVTVVGSAGCHLSVSQVLSEVQMTYQNQ
jgi:hypothetical protein